MYMYGLRDIETMEKTLNYSLKVLRGCAYSKLEGDVLQAILSLLGLKDARRWLSKPVCWDR